MGARLFAVFAAICLAAPAYAQTFLDVPPDHWAYNYIEPLAVSGITAGCGDGNYCPLSEVTRAQMAVFLERSMRGGGFRPPAAKGNVFLDVSATSFAASFIEQLYLDGITSGCGGHKYCPDVTVSRDQMAVFLLRAKHGSAYSPPPATGLFDDVPLSHWAVHWIEQLAREGITSGCGGSNFCPSTAVTRDQMAVFLVRAFDLALPPLVSLSASTDVVFPGALITLSWSSQWASSCVASGAWSGSRPATGSEEVIVNDQSTYSLTCSGLGGRASESLTVSTPSEYPETEYNDERAFADIFYLNSTAVGSLANAYDVDWFTVNIDQQIMAKVKFDVTSATSGVWNVYWYDKDMNVLSGRNINASSTAFEYEFPAFNPGPYYLRVQPTDPVLYGGSIYKVTFAPVP